MVVHVDYTRSEEEMPRGVPIVRSGRLIVAGPTYEAHIAIAIAVARSREEDGIAIWTNNLITTASPSPCTFVF